MSFNLLLVCRSCTSFVFIKFSMYGRGGVNCNADCKVFRNHCKCKKLFTENLMGYFDQTVSTIQGGGGRGLGMRLIICSFLSQEYNDSPYLMHEFISH